MDPAQTSRSKVRRNLLQSEVKDHTDRLNVQRQTDRQGGVQTDTIGTQRDLMDRQVTV